MTGINTDCTNIPPFVYRTRSIRTAGDVCFFISFRSAFAGSWDFLIYLAAILSVWEHNPEATRTHLTECRGRRRICCIRGDQSRRELILHQVSSIFLGSGSLGRRSLDTRKTVCTSRPRGGLYGKRRLRSPLASRLQTKGFSHMHRWTSSVRIYLNISIILFSKYKGQSCFTAPPRPNTRGTLY